MMTAIVFLAVAVPVWAQLGLEHSFGLQLEPGLKLDTTLSDTRRG